MESGSIPLMSPETTRALQHQVKVIRSAPEASLENLQVVHSTLSRRGELGAARDRWGNVDFGGLDDSERQRVSRPWLDEHLGARNVALWPGTRSSFVMALSHDVDVLARRLVPRRTALVGFARAFRATGSSVDRLRQVVRWAARLALPRPGAGPEWTFDQWTTLEDRYGYRSTFFFFPERLERAHVWDCCYSWSDPVQFNKREISVRELMRELVAGGWEVGLHGSVMAATDARMLRRQKEALEEAAGHPVRALRMHYLRWDPAITPNVVAEAGFSVDSTLGFNAANGFRSGTSFPHPLFDPTTGSPLPVSEVPLHLMDSALLDPSALGLTPEEAKRQVTRLLSVVERVGGCLGCNWHPNHASVPGWFAAYEHLLESAQRRGATGLTVSAAADLAAVRGSAALA